MILAIGGGVETVSGFDAPRESARQALDRVALWGSSPIGDTVVQAVDALGEQRGRRAVVLWSDGVEKEAQRARADVLEHVRRADVLIYPVAIAPSISPLLAELAALSGGRVLQARDREAAPRRAAGEIADGASKPVSARLREAGRRERLAPHRGARQQAGAARSRASGVFCAGCRRQRVCRGPSGV